MKKALRLVLMYFVFLIGGILLGSVIYMFFQNVLGFVAGKKIAAFEWHHFLLSVIFITQCLIFIICPLMSYYRLRHSGGISTLITYIILCVFTWGVLLPFSLYISKSVGPKLQIEFEQQSLSGGFFRRYDDKIVYLTEDLPSEDSEKTSVNMLVIDTSKNGEITEVRAGINSLLYEKSSPFRDILIKNNFNFTDNRSIINFNLLILNADYAWYKGFTHWIGYLSLGFLISALYGLVSIFSWKLVNAVICFFSTFLVLVFNTIYYGNMFMSFRNLPFLHNSFFSFLDKYLDEPFICLVNILLALICIAGGIIKFAVSKKKEKN